MPKRPTSACCGAHASCSATRTSRTCCACCATPGARSFKTRARRRTAPAAPEDLHWVADARADPELAADARLAYDAMAALSEPLRATIVAVDVVGLSYAEAARSLRTRTGTIMSRLYRARERVAAALETP